MSTRGDATALLDALGYGTEQDQTREHCERARRFEACFRRGGEVGAWPLAQRLRIAVGDSRQAPAAAASLAQICWLPTFGLAWAWADHGCEPGQLDLRSRRPGIDAASKPGDYETALGAVLRFFGRAPRGVLVLAGDTGTGKTLAACFAAVHHGGRFVRAAELGELALGSRDSLRALAREPVLVVDELGRETDIRPTPARLIELLGDRHDQGLGTIVTTQLLRRDPKPELSFADRYGHHLLDRIERAGRWVSLAHKSRRSDAAPLLGDLARSCRVAHLLPRVEAATGAGAPEAAREVAELQALMGVGADALEDAARQRARWLPGLTAQSAGLAGPVGDAVRRIVADAQEALR